METEVRVAKVEEKVDSLEKLTHLNMQALVRLEDRIAQGFAEQRAATERGLAELRRDVRWALGIMLTGFIAILGVLGRLGGWY